MHFLQDFPDGNEGSPVHMEKEKSQDNFMRGRVNGETVFNPID